MSILDRPHSCTANIVACLCMQLCNGGPYLQAMPKLREAVAVAAEKWLQCIEVTRAVAVALHISVNKVGACCCAPWPASTKHSVINTHAIILEILGAPLTHPITLRSPLEHSFCMLTRFVSLYGRVRRCLLGNGTSCPPIQLC